MQATKEAIWITKLIMDLGYMEEKKMMVIWCDNQCAISLSSDTTWRDPWSRGEPTWEFTKCSLRKLGPKGTLPASNSRKG
jgi:hypothetical protein